MTVARKRATELTVARSPTAGPLYQQVKDQILGHVVSGEWSPGRKIPSENELVRELGVSRMTVNRALRELTDEGHLQGVAGVGRFVAEPPSHASLVELKDIAEEVRASGAEHRAHLCWRGRKSLGRQLADRLELPVGSEADHVTLVHYRGELPVQLEDRWVNPELVPDFLTIDFSTTTPSQHLLRTVRADEMEHVVQATMPDPSICELLAIPPSEPCLRLERRTWNGDRVVTFAILTYPSSRYDLGARYSLRGERRVESRAFARRTPSPEGLLEPPDNFERNLP